MHGIETNPNVIREVSETIKEYGIRQMDIVSEYLYHMGSLQECIETEAYEEIIFSLKVLKEEMEVLYYQAMVPFVAYLREKADYLDKFMVQSVCLNENITLTTFAEKGMTDMWVEPLYQPVDCSACLSAPITYLPEAEFKPETYEEGKYQTYEVVSELTVYRYFGSFDSLGCKESRTEVEDFWGSDAAGVWASSIRTTNPERARKLLALKQSWGNDAMFVAEIKIPVGTIVSIGKAAPQGNLSGGGEQIYIHRKKEITIKSPEEANLEYEKEIRSWILRCGPIETFNFNS